MDFLLDTHIALWLMNGDPRITDEIREVLSNKRNKFYYSVISMWEVSIKHTAKPDSLSETGISFMHKCEQSGFEKLAFDDRHIVALESLAQNPEKPVHRDPFDRILLAQAKADGMTLLTHDTKFLSFNEPYYRVM